MLQMISSPRDKSIQYFNCDCNYLQWEGMFVKHNFKTVFKGMSFGDEQLRMDYKPSWF